MIQPKLQKINGDLWRVLESWPCLEYTVPAGFFTDLDSIPRIGIIYLLFKNRTVGGAVLHDWLLFNDTPPNEADRAFLRAMRAENVRLRYRVPIYLAVRAWHHLRPRRKKGGKQA